MPIPGSEFRLLMLTAMYENGGNTTHRLLDGHPQLYVYPFESQLGTRLVADHLTSMFPVKYRWPWFNLSGTPTEDYRLIIDEECKVRARTPHVSKFRDFAFDFDDEDRRCRYEAIVGQTGRSRANNMAAFFEATFEAWKDYRRTGRQAVYVGYSPVLVVDALRILAEMPLAHVLHVVRNPWSAYADTKKRPVPLSLDHYVLAWNLNQYFALLAQQAYPQRMHIVRLEDELIDPTAALGPVCSAVGIELNETLRRPSWNAQELAEVYPWGTIREPTPEANRRTAEELSADERAAVRLRAEPYLERFGYTDFLPR